MKQILKAIQSINPNTQVSLKCVSGDSNDINNVIFDWNGDTVISNADIEAKIAEMPTDEQLATAKATAQASGNTKLLALGLTQAEATALTGFTPSED